MESDSFSSIIQAIFCQTVLKQNAIERLVIIQLKTKKNVLTNIKLMMNFRGENKYRYSLNYSSSILTLINKESLFLKTENFYLYKFFFPSQTFY